MMNLLYSKRIMAITVLTCFLFCLESFPAEISGNAGPMATISKSLPIPGEVFSVTGHVAFLIKSKNIVPGKKSPWIWYAPTLTGLPGPEEVWMFTKFLAAGISIAGIDVGESYGSPTGTAQYQVFYEEMVQNRGFSEKACLLPRSRGGLMLYNWAAEHPAAVQCVAGVYPVCDLSSYPGLATACSAYKMTKTQLAARLTEFNPIDRMQGLAQAKVPIFHIHGDTDTVVPLEQNSAELARRYQKLGGEMILMIAKGQGHSMWTGFFTCQELVDFLISHVPADIRSATEAGDFK